MDDGALPDVVFIQCNFVWFGARCAFQWHISGFAAFVEQQHKRVGQHLRPSEWARFEHAAGMLRWIADSGLIGFYLFVAEA